MVLKISPTKPKSKSGCRTCKIRKVKCDETFPICQRCQSTGRTCDGYGIWGGGGKVQHPNRPPSHKISPTGCASVTIVPSKTFRIKVSSEEQLLLDWFANRTSIKLPGAFTSDFWNSVLFQVSSTEPAVLHAVVALSSTHKRVALETVDSQTPNLVTLQQYTTAIKCLQMSSTGARQGLVRTTLVSCLVFIYLELLQSRYQVALLHLQHGLTLLKQKREADGTRKAVMATWHDDRIDVMFGRMYIQAKLFAQEIEPRWEPMHTPHECNEIETLTSNNQARQCLDLILLDIIALQDAFRTLQPKPNTKAYSKLQVTQLELRSKLDTWYKVYQPVFDILQDRPVALDHFAQKLLYVHHTMATVMLHGSIAADETVYNDCTGHFISILDQSVKLYTVALAKRSTKSKYGAAFQHNRRKPDTAHDAVVDIGTVAPLYLVALRCRNWTLRNRALQLLRLAPHKEGMLDSNLAANVAQKVMELEGHFHYGEDEPCSHVMDCMSYSEEDKLADFAAAVPSSQMVRDINIHLPEDGNGLLTMICQRNGIDDNAGSSVHTFDTAFQVWLS